MKRAGEALALAVALLCACARTVTGAPASAKALDVLPSLLELHVSPGETIERRVTLTNPGDEPLEVSTEIADWTMSAAGEVRFEVPGSGRADPRGCAGWIAVTPSKVRVPAKGHAAVSVRISTPPELDGTRWAVVFFRLPEAPGFYGGRPADIVARVGLTVYVTGSGTERESFELSELTATATPEIQLRASFENAGNTAVRVRMTWQVRAPSGAVVRTDTVTLVSLPGSRREAIDRVPHLPPGTYKVTGMARWGNRRWRVRECFLEVAPGRPAHEPSRPGGGRSLRTWPVRCYLLPPWTAGAGQSPAESGPPVTGSPSHPSSRESRQGRRAPARLL